MDLGSEIDLSSEIDLGSDILLPSPLQLRPLAHPKAVMLVA